MPLLEYILWQRFSNVIKKTIENCQNSNYKILDHFANVDKMVNIGSNMKRKNKDFCLSRYACYLITQNIDPRKKL